MTVETNVKAVIFDLDDTLLWDERSVKEAFGAASEEAARRKGVDAEELESAVRKRARELYATYETFPFTQMIGINPFEGLWARFDKGEQPEFRKLQEIAPLYRKEAWRLGLEDTGIEDPELALELSDLFAAERRKRPYVYDETYEVLGELQGRVKLLLLTNGCPSLQQEKLDAVPQLVSYFDHIVISGTFGKGKPDTSIFRHALGLLGVSPEEALMVGDKQSTDIRGALDTGIPSVWINRGGRPPHSGIVPVYEIDSLRDLPELAGIRIS
ncbi:HAD family hydrolase [Saccharibacillus alkalitolerans]|uniref:Phosphoserine phosphatase n=1 Tax=Saccharibacillus alkalitolerans TaxID=2705290 RepID=A0ABX0F5M0_9BACL|nr:HAD family hydrolase [Saccharibacillus alkalitolerans]NGZ74486.1 HAD family hydrolase [Saccharibacillus alkalitolerans]